MLATPTPEIRPETEYERAETLVLMSLFGRPMGAPLSEIGAALGEVEPWPRACVAVVRIQVCGRVLLTQGGRLRLTFTGRLIAGRMAEGAEGGKGGVIDLGIEKPIAGSTRSLGAALGVR